MTQISEQDRAAMRRTTEELNAGMRRMFEQSPELQRALGRIVGREPRCQEWQAEDGWIIVYSTERMGTGKFEVAAYKPIGRGARSGRARKAAKAYERQFATRKAAKARAIALYRQHSPRWSERHPGKAYGEL